jgi:hypothetical protein
MTPTTSSWPPLALSCAMALAALLGAASAGAQTQHPLSGNMRFERGGGRPLSGPATSVQGVTCL